jgi:hypothetical protein
MRTTVGSWIDHRKAVIVAVSEKGEETRETESDVEKQPGRFALDAPARRSYKPFGTKP